MNTLDSLWRELYQNIKTISESDHSRLALRCDTLSFYELAICLSWDIPETICREARMIEQETAQFQVDFSLEDDEEETRYFRFLNNFDTYITEDLMLLISHRIDIELYRSYTQHSNYKKYLNNDGRLKEIFKINRSKAISCKNDICKNRGIKVGKQLYLPIQFRKTLRLIEGV